MNAKGVDIVLIQPSYTMGAWIHNPILGLGYIASNLNKEGINCAIIDDSYQNLGIARLLDVLKTYDAKIFGITSLTSEIIKAHSLALAIKKAIPGSVIIAGGNHISTLPEETLREFSAFDFVVVGEGEYTALELVTKLKNKDTDFSGVKGIAYRESGKIKVTPKRDWITSLDDLPFPAWHLYPNIKNQKVFSLITSRGCPFRCIFCNRALGDTVRCRSLENVMEEIEWLITDFGAKIICFEDDNLIFKNERTERFLDICIKKEISKKITWHAQFRADKMDFELLRKLKLAGCAHIYFGAESGSKEILGRINKDIILENGIEIVKNCKKLGINIGTSFILGHPGETVKDINKTIQFAARLNASRVEFHIMTPFPGTQIAEFAKKNKNDYKLISTDWSRYNPAFAEVMEFKNIGNKRIKLLHLKAYLVFFIRNLRFKELFLMFWKRKWSYVRQVKSILINRNKLI